MYCGAAGFDVTRGGYEVSYELRLGSPSDCASSGARVRSPATVFRSPPSAALRPAAQLVAVAELQLVEECCEVVLHRLRRDPELESHLLVEVAARDELEHLALAWPGCMSTRLLSAGRSRIATPDSVAA